MHDIFVGYAHKDKPMIKQLVKALKDSGWTVWWDPNVRAGKYWDPEIQKALEESRCVIVVWSEASILSKYVLEKEAAIGKQRGVLVPVLLNTVTIPKPFDEIQAQSLIGWNGKRTHSIFEELALAVKELLGSSDPLLTIYASHGPVYDAAWSPDGKWLATGSENEAAVWDSTTGEKLMPLDCRKYRVLSVAWSPDGKRLATGVSGVIGTDNEDKSYVIVWDTETGGGRKLIQSSWSTMCVAWSPDGNWLAAGNKILNAESGKERLILDTEDVMCVAWSPDGKLLATENKVWDAETGKELLTLEVDDLQYVTSVAWSPNGKQLVTGAADGGWVQVWNAKTGKELLSLDYDSNVLCVAWCPDGKRIATSSDDGDAKVWDAKTGDEVWTLSHEGYVHCAAWNPDGKLLVTGASGVIEGSFENDGWVKVWNVGV